MDKSEVVIVGGGAIGASIAYFLREHPRAPRVTVVERDPSYALASTPRASGGVRRLFSLPENIALSNFSIPFFERFSTTMAVGGEPADISFRKGGYLFIVQEQGRRVLEQDLETQARLGANVVLLDQAGIAARFPSMRVDDLAAASHSPDDGWLDPYGVLRGFRRKAISLGAEFIADEVIGMEISNGLLRTLHLRKAGDMAADVVVNAAGAWASIISNARSQSSRSPM